jgi:hypothetical protein
MSNNFIEEILGMKVQSNKPPYSKKGKLNHFDTDHKPTPFEHDPEESYKPTKPPKPLLKSLKGTTPSFGTESNEDFPNYEVDMIPKFL